MIGYTLRRLAVMLPVLLALSFVVFLLMRTIPGDPVGSILGLQATPEAMAALRAKLNLDKPILTQYVMWLGDVFRGDFGTDYRAHKPIGELILQRIPVTFELTALAMFFSLIISLPLASLAAIRADSAVDHVAVLVSLVGITMPDFWIGMMLILTISLRLDLLPASGFVPIAEGLGSNLKHLLLPAVTLSIAAAAVQIRMLRSAFLEQLSQDYVSFARAKGLAERIVLLKHVLRNAGPTLVTVVGMQTGYILGGAIVVEQLFGIPGIGRLTVTAVFNRNYPLVQMCVIALAFFFMLINLVTDVICRLLNPQVE